MWAMGPEPVSDNAMHAEVPDSVYNLIETRLLMACKGALSRYLGAF